MKDPDSAPLDTELLLCITFAETDTSIPFESLLCSGSFIADAGGEIYFKPTFPSALADSLEFKCVGWFDLPENLP